MKRSIVYIWFGQNIKPLILSDNLKSNKFVGSVILKGTIYVISALKLLI